MPSCENKVCKDNKICNPNTGRCNKPKKRTISCADKICPSGKVCNPQTIRCKKMIQKTKIELMKTMNDRLYFYSKSKDTVPGKGVHETVKDVTAYENLSKIKDWRKILSNFHTFPFKYDGNMYNTIEHVFQGKKIELVDKEKALYFTLDSGNDIGKGDGEIARKNRKLVKLNAEQLKLWNTMKDKIMFEAALAKYSVCIEAQNVLKSTNSAQLWHVVPRSQPVRFIHLEVIRNNL
jgi:ribA/ribD-fused uncharacterized protein